VSAKHALNTLLVISGIEKVPRGRGGRSMGVGIGTTPKVPEGDELLGSLLSVSHKHRFSQYATYW